VGRDPIEEEGGLNLYGFVRNNPMNAWDDLGMETFLMCEPYYDDNGNMLGTRMVEHDEPVVPSGRARGDDRIETQFGYLSAQYFQSWGVANGWRTGDLTNPFNALSEVANAGALYPDGTPIDFGDFGDVTIREDELSADALRNLVMSGDMFASSGSPRMPVPNGPNPSVRLDRGIWATIRPPTSTARPGPAPSDLQISAVGASPARVIRISVPTTMPGIWTEMAYVSTPNGWVPLYAPSGGSVGIRPNGVDVHSFYPNGSNAFRINPQGHLGNPTPHMHAHLPGTGPGPRPPAQGPSLDTNGNVVPPNSPAAHWPLPPP